MKITMIAMVALVAVCGLAVNVPENVADIFAEWAVAHKRTYASDAERKTRLGYFYRNFQLVADLNNAHAHRPDGARFKLNKFADWSEAELRSLNGFSVKKSDRAAVKEAEPVKTKAPASFDWRSKGVVSAIQDQGSCGSCWAFSATANIESRWAISKGASALTKLSEQNLVDCDKECGTYRDMQGCDAGCNGGLMPNAFKYVIANGQASESAYPYQGYDGTCQKFSRANVTVRNWEFVSTDEAQIADYLAANGPIAIAVDASYWSFYAGGIMEYLCFGRTTVDDLNHGVDLVGYGTSGSTAYWIVRNSWGTSWGESGYAQVLRGSGFCGLNLFACSAVV